MNIFPFSKQTRCITLQNSKRINQKTVSKQLLCSCQIEDDTGLYRIEEHLIRTEEYLVVLFGRIRFYLIVVKNKHTTPIVNPREYVFFKSVSPNACYNKH